MIDHITLIVSDLERSKNFFKRALKPLDYELVGEEERRAGFGVEDVEGKRDFWIVEKPHEHDSSLSCLAFEAKNKEAVEAFYEAALEAGGAENYAPKYWEKYHSGYYAAFVHSPTGHNIEAVFDDPNPP
jgi:catechol 2,3-dioxygenase-like lactoylglutathione lyase family enzyme